MSYSNRIALLTSLALAACTHSVDEPGTFDTAAGEETGDDSGDAPGEDPQDDGDTGQDDDDGGTTGDDDGTTGGGGDDDDDGGTGEPGGTTGDDPVGPVCGNFAVEDGEDCDGEGGHPNVECNGECAFECTADFGDCNDSVETDGCESWLRMADNCGACGVVCEAGNSCVMGVCEVTSTHGHDEEMPEKNTALAHNLLGSLINIPEDVTVTHLSAFSKVAGPNGQLALYQDVGGEPGALVAQTPEVGMIEGLIEMPLDQPVQVPAGDYWLMGIYDINASVGLDVSDASAVVMYVPHTFGTPLPDPFPMPASYTGQILNYFVTVQ